MPLWVFALAVNALAVTLPDCAAGEQAGEVVGPAKWSDGRTAPRVQRGAESGIVAPGDALCANDVLSNPPQAKADVNYRLIGQHPQALPPGQSFGVSKPVFPMVLSEWIEAFQSVFPSHRVRGAGIRGQQGGGVYPLQQDAYVVPAWGPIVLAWSGGGVGVVTLTGSGSAKTFQGVGHIAFDPMRYCATGCALRFNVPSLQIDQSTNLIVRPTMRLQAELSAPFDIMRAPPAIAGGWLAFQQDDLRWELQAASLLWKAACMVPAADLASAQAYELKEPHDPCVLDPVKR